MSQRVLFLVCFAAQSAVADMPACPFAKKGSEKEVELANKIQEAVKKLNGSLPGNQADELAAAATRYLEALKKNPSPDKKTSEEIVESLSSLNDKMDTLFKQYDKIQNGNRKEAVLDAGILVSSVLRRSPEGRVVELGLSLTRALLHKVGGYFVQRDNAKIDEEVKKTKRLADFPALGCLYYDLQAARMKERPDAQAADVFKLAQMTLGP